MNFHSVEPPPPTTSHTRVSSARLLYTALAWAREMRAYRPYPWEPPFCGHFLFLGEGATWGTPFRICKYY
jgi:hypothetical protein